MVGVAVLLVVLPVAVCAVAVAVDSPRTLGVGAYAPAAGQKRRALGCPAGRAASGTYCCSKVSISSLMR